MVKIMSGEIMKLSEMIVIEEMLDELVYVEVFGIIDIYVLGIG